MDNAEKTIPSSIPAWVARIGWQAYDDAGESVETRDEQMQHAFGAMAATLLGRPVRVYFVEHFPYTRAEAIAEQDLADHARWQRLQAALNYRRAARQTEIERVAAEEGVGLRIEEVPEEARGADALARTVLATIDPAEPLSDAELMLITPVEDLPEGMKERMLHNIALDKMDHPEKYEAQDLDNPTDPHLPHNFKADGSGEYCQWCGQGAFDKPHPQDDESVHEAGQASYDAQKATMRGDIMAEAVKICQGVKVPEGLYFQASRANFEAGVRSCIDALCSEVSKADRPEPSAADLDEVAANHAEHLAQNPVEDFEARVEAAKDLPEEERAKTLHELAEEADARIRNGREEMLRPAPANE